uniref:Glutaredoxin domain-containing protein n=1 Tax=Heterorhabditis bacteriophora TaxID=37862 RepID=A0A1I7XQU0_HETBA
MSGSAYARLVPKLRRSKKLPKIDRPWRPHMIAWAGPAAFYPNRFYEIDNWYKARIDKPENVPKFHIIDPANHQLSLAELLKKVYHYITLELPEAINIGFKPRYEAIIPKSTKQKEHLEKNARNMERKFYKMDIAFGHNGVYCGNIIAAETTNTTPKVSIESIKSHGFNTLVMVNIDGNPYDKHGEIAQWIVANIPDGYDIEHGNEILPYMQPLPFCGTGYHRISFVLFRHEEPIVNFPKLDSMTLIGRVFSLSDFYKISESVLTPSAISFFQSSYDDSVKQQMHSMGVLNFFLSGSLLMKCIVFPFSFRYFDMYRDSKDVDAEVLEERLKRAQLDDYQEDAMAPVKVFVTSITANPEIRARVRRTRALLEALGIDFDAIDITEAGNEEQRIFMRENAIKEGVKGPPLAPQFFFNNEYLGDYSDFDEAVENNQIAEFLRLTPNSKEMGEEVRDRVRRSAIEASSISASYLLPDASDV